MDAKMTIIPLYGENGGMGHDEMIIQKTPNYRHLGFNSLIYKAKECAQDEMIKILITSRASNSKYKEGVFNYFFILSSYKEFNHIILFKKKRFKNKQLQQDDNNMMKSASFIIMENSNVGL